MKKLLSILSVALFTIASFQVQAQDASLDEIIDNYFENIGGVDAWKKVKSTKMTGTTTTPNGVFDIEVIGMEPNLTKITVNVQNMEIVFSAYDGETGWTLNPFGGSTEATKMPEEATAEMKKQPFQDEFIDYKEKGSTVELLGTKEIDGTETYEVKLVKKDGTEKFYYFDTENFVPIMQKQTLETPPMNGMVMETYMSDYQEVDGLMIAHSVESKVGGQSAMEMTAEKIEINAESVTKESFMMPKKADDNK
ncbi:MAG: outer membrane lipoprotein-sorting protein [Bacteroidota bacterium]